MRLQFDEEGFSHDGLDIAGWVDEDFLVTSPEVSVALSGVTVTAAPGALVPALTRGLTGSALTATPGTLAQSATAALSWVSVTSAAGTLAPTMTRALTGNQLTAALGALAQGTSVALSRFEAKRNVLTYTEQLQTAAWVIATASVTISPDAAVAPDGTTTAELVAEAANTGGHYFVPFPNGAYLSFVAGQTYTASAHVKHNAGTRFFELVLLQNAFGTHIIVNYDHTTGTSQLVMGSGTHGMVSLGDGWWRCWVTGVAVTTVVTQIQLRYTTSMGLAAPSYLGDPAQSFFVWGVQLEPQSLSAYQRVVAAYVPIDTGLALALGTLAPFMARGLTGIGFAAQSGDVGVITDFTLYAALTGVSITAIAGNVGPAYGELAPANDMVVRPADGRVSIRPAEGRSATRPAAYATAARPAENRVVVRN